MRWLSGALFALLPLAVHAQQPDAVTVLGENERIATLALLWQEVNYNFAYFDQVPELDWTARFTAYLPQVRAARDTYEFYRVLQGFLAGLNDGHTLVFFPDSIIDRRPVDVPWVELEEVERRAFVANVDAALATLLPVGSEVLRIDGTDVPEHLRLHVFPILAASTEHVRWRDGIRGNSRHMWGLLAGAAGSSFRLTARTPAGDSVEVELIRDRSRRSSSWSVPAPRRQLVGFRQLDEQLAYVALNSFNDDAIVEEFDSLMPLLRESGGLVLDLRRNGGGRDQVATRILERLTADTLLGPAWRTRTHIATYRAWGRFADEAAWADMYRAYWSGGGEWHTAPPDTLVPGSGATLTVPVVVLIGSQTASAAENFLIHLHGHERFTLVGQPTNGSSGQPLMLDLPGGGRAWICTKRNTYPDGRTYIGTGIVPDVAVPVTANDVRIGRDAALEIALAILRERVLPPR
jgi:carboxyl-terminal processing protease